MKRTVRTTPFACSSAGRVLSDVMLVKAGFASRLALAHSLGSASSCISRPSRPRSHSCRLQGLACNTTLRASAMQRSAYPRSGVWGRVSPRCSFCTLHPPLPYLSGAQGSHRIWNRVCKPKKPERSPALRLLHRKLHISKTEKALPQGHKNDDDRGGVTKIQICIRRRDPAPSGWIKTRLL